MSLRALITGFEPFPGAPFNPTQALVKSLGRLRRPALADVTIATHVFPVTYAAVGFLKRREGIDVYDRGTDFTPFRARV